MGSTAQEMVACEMKEEWSPRKAGLGDWAPLSSPKGPHSLQKGLSSTAPALWLEGPVHCNNMRSSETGDTRGCPETVLSVWLWSPVEGGFKSPGDCICAWSEGTFKKISLCNDQSERKEV